jgi:16S rRNA G966 N2-methylase RsmD
MATISTFSAATSRTNPVDLVYLDPPFKSNQDYNVLFAEKDGTGAAAQFKAFEDTWEWNQLSAAMYEEIVERGGRVRVILAKSARTQAALYQHPLGVPLPCEVSDDAQKEARHS